ncbi:hypothetical protein O9993_11410 [Vibrio lentus]|nr:hypothetical protein [Vibrio lentus]
MFTDNISFEVLAASPFSHNISATGLGEIADTKHLPPTFMVQYYLVKRTVISGSYGCRYQLHRILDESLKTKERKILGLSDLSL